MLKRNYGKRIAAGVLAVIVAMTTVLSGAGSVLTAEAASSYENGNLIGNPDFEEANVNFAEVTGDTDAAGRETGIWYSYLSAEKSTEAAHSGETSVKLSETESALEQDIPDLQVGMTYVYSVWAKLSGESDSAKHWIGVKYHGGTEQKVLIDSTEWKQYTFEFKYTDDARDARVYAWVEELGGVESYFDDASVTVESDVESVSIENGQLTVKFAESYTPSETDLAALTATYSVTPGDAAANELNLTLKSWDAGTKTAVLSFPEITAIPVDQTVTVNLSYRGATITLDYTVDANGEEVVTANLKSVLITKNGQIKAVLDKNPTVMPDMDDFTWEYKVGDDEYQTAPVENYVYDSETKTATVSLTRDVMRSLTMQLVTAKVGYDGGSGTASIIVEASSASTFYVDSTDGSDENDGLSPETAFASIDKLNMITFLPGDQILFKKGETFVGCFKPQGSGTEEAPITIGSYGDVDERPVLQPGEDWQVSHIMSADRTVYNVNVNYVIQFYNVEYWEVSDLELEDPTPQTDNSPSATYCSGITIQGEDIGTLEHFYIDNVIIHGFHGPGTNIGKTSGGITMNVITNSEWDRSRSVPTQINDIRITNCEIYDVGRSGINFLTPWAYRKDEKWGSYGTGQSSYEWLPYTDFYLGNNYIHDIDGDGCIIDNCANAVVENNLVTRCVTRLHESAKMAVGLFNWNSDDTYFQFNEVYDIQIGGSEAYNDGQGIEIDALNDRTWVQYNSYMTTEAAS